MIFRMGVGPQCWSGCAAVSSAGIVGNGTPSPIVVESAIDPMESEIPYVRFVRSSQYAGPKSEGDQRLPGHWHPNMTALEDLFYESGFTEVDRLFKEGGRGGIVARR